MNTQLINEIREAYKSNIAVERLPNPIPVVEVNPKIVKNAFPKSINAITSGSITIYTTPTNQDFYLTTIAMSYAKDAACDMATGRIVISTTINGAVIELVGFAVITLTAQSQNVFISFPHPIKIDRGVNISTNNTWTAGVCARVASITGFLDEYGNA